MRRLPLTLTGEQLIREVEGAIARAPRQRKTDKSMSGFDRRLYRRFSSGDQRQVGGG